MARHEACPNDGARVHGARGTIRQQLFYKFPAAWRWTP